MACYCIAEKNEELRKSDPRVFLINALSDTRKGTCQAVVEVFHPGDPIDSCFDSPAPVLVADFCPFCGVRYIPLDAPTDTTPTKED